MTKLRKHLRAVKGKNAEWTCKAQEKALYRIYAKNDDFVVRMPTGAGKSLLFELPAATFNGEKKKWPVVITPFVSLKEQVKELYPKKGLSVIEWRQGVEIPEDCVGIVVVTSDTSLNEKFIR